MSISKLTYVTALVAVFLQIAFLSSALAQEKPLTVFILAGQSNMVGRGKVVELPDELKLEQKRVLMFSGNEWLPLAPSPKENASFGPELSFGHEMAARLQEPIGLIKLARDGSSLAGDWNPDDPKSLYAELLARVAAARRDRPLEIVGVCWMQGGGDAKEKEMADAYAQNFSRFIERVRKDFGNPKLIFVAGRVTAPKTFIQTVRVAQEKCPLPNYAWIDCDKLSQRPDTHYDTKGQVDLGHNFAAAMLKLVQSSGPEASNTTKGNRR